MIPRDAIQWLLAQSRRLLFIGILVGLAICFLTGCSTPGAPFAPLSAEEQLKLDAKAMAQDICGKNQMSHCYTQAKRWFYRLNGLVVNGDGEVTAPKYCKKVNAK